MVTSDEATWVTTDLGSAAFAHFRGLLILGVTNDGHGKFTFRFSDPEHKGKQLQIDYMNSECRRYDEALRSLKKLCYDPAPTTNRQDRQEGARRGVHR